MKIISIKKSKKIVNNYFEDSILSVDCAEEPLPIFGCCILGAINLTQFIDIENKTWDFDKLSNYIGVAVRFMDNIIEIANPPLQEQVLEMKNKRRIGIGRMGYASSLIMMKIRYGSKEALKLTEDLESFVANEIYKASSILAKEKGSFALFDKEKYLQSNFLKVLDKETIDLIEKYGIRNSHLLTVAPNGNTSSLANIVSGGLEPIFSFSVKRNFITPEVPVGLDLPKKVDWINKTFSSTSKWNWISEGNDNLLTIQFEKNKYCFDSNRGLTKEVIIKDYGINYLEEHGGIDETNNFIYNISDLTLDDHIETMKIFAKYCDASISKTINLPNDFPFSEFKNLYLKLYNTGVIKGGTTYRAGTMMSVISSVNQNEDETTGEVLIKNNAPKRPKKLKCDIHHITAKGQEWVVLVGLMNGGQNPLTPYEVFAFKEKSIDISHKILSGYLIKIKSGHYKLETEFVSFDNITELFEQDEEEALTRMISIALRHGVDIKYIVEQLNKSEGSLASFSKAIVRALKKYIVDPLEIKELCQQCGSKLVFSEGCVKCSKCEFSKCG